MNMLDKTLWFIDSTLDVFTLFFLSSFFCNLFLNYFSLYFFKKIIIQKSRRWYFTVAIATLSHFSTTLKISLRSYMFLLTRMNFIIFYYLKASIFYSHLYFSRDVKKHINDIYTLIILL
jgi:hypothetical protein